MTSEDVSELLIPAVSWMKLSLMLFEATALSMSYGLVLNVQQDHA